MQVTKSLVLGVVTLIFTSCSHQNYKNDKSSLEGIVSGSHRSSKNKARDKYRNPVETLKFFEVEPNMTVVEVSPGRGWYTEILGPYLKDSGTLYLTLFSENSKRSYAAPSNKAVKEMTSNKELFGDVRYTTLEAPEDLGPVAPENSADRILTFRNVHSWARTGHGKQVFQAFYKALKPGGVLGIVQHRLPEDRPVKKSEHIGYLKESRVIDLAKSVGFKLVGKSEVNANPKDTADHPGGVWSLPPSLRNKDTDKKKYLEIGESDRMTLKFMKPKKS